MKTVCKIRHHEIESAIESAREAGLHYVTDKEPGYTRVKKGRGFAFLDSQGKPIKDAKTLARIKHLAIPPAYNQVWICPDPRGHIQATARDGRGRKQYRYHDRWRETRDANKYDKMLDFAGALPKIRARTEGALRLPGLPKEKVLATVVQLLEKTSIRVGNDEYARENGSYGLTTLREKHVDVEGSRIHFEFKGKSNIEHEIDIKDQKLAGIVRTIQELPGQHLFQYVDEKGELHRVSSDDVNSYLREISGAEFTAKDFRTWAGTVCAALALQEYLEFSSLTEAKRYVTLAIESVSRKLGNTKAVCRKCYVHPVVIEAYFEKEKLEITATAQKRFGLTGEEKAVVKLLERRLKKGLKLKSA